MSADLLDEAYRDLQREYLSELPKALADLRRNIEAFRRGEDVSSELKTGFHRLAGSGGSYGFPEISEIARYVISFYFHIYLIFYTCVQIFDVTRNLVNFWQLNEA
jgi:hypothetical protein